MLTVQGADDGGTVLLSDNPDIPLLEHMGTGSSFSNLEFRSSGAPVLVRSGYNITIRDSLVAPTQDAWHDLQQLFVSNSYRLLYSRVEGWGGEQGNCRSPLVAESYTPNTRPSGIYIQNTLFRDNSCIHPATVQLLWCPPCQRRCSGEQTKEVIGCSLGQFFQRYAT